MTTDTNDLIEAAARQCDVDLDNVVTAPVMDNNQVWIAEYRENWQDEGPHYLIWRYEKLPDDVSAESDTHVLEIPEAYAGEISALTHATTLHSATKAAEEEYSQEGGAPPLSLRDVAEQFGISSPLAEGNDVE